MGVAVSPIWSASTCAHRRSKAG
ncbi:hypothetical protein [Pseudomonas sp. ANT_H4]